MNKQLENAMHQYCGTDSVPMQLNDALHGDAAYARVVGAEAFSVVCRLVGKLGDLSHPDPQVPALHVPEHDDCRVTLMNRVREVFPTAQFYYYENNRGQPSSRKLHMGFPNCPITVASVGWGNFLDSNSGQHRFAIWSPFIKNNRYGNGERQFMALAKPEKLFAQKLRQYVRMFYPEELALATEYMVSWLKRTNRSTADSQERRALGEVQDSMRDVEFIHSVSNSVRQNTNLQLSEKVLEQLKVYEAAKDKVQTLKHYYETYGQTVIQVHIDKATQSHTAMLYQRHEWDEKYYCKISDGPLEKLSKELQAKIATVDLLSSDKEFESLRNRSDGLCWHEGVGTAAVKGELYYLAP